MESVEARHEVHKYDLRTETMTTLHTLLMALLTTLLQQL
jgi:hypothetical protein